MIEKLRKLNNQLKSRIYFNYALGKQTWFKAGGKAKIFIIVENKNELEILINTLKGFKYLIIGAGSNLLVRDNGFNGAIIKLGKGFNQIKIVEDEIIVGASILDVNFSKFAKNNFIKNFEFYSGIPGTIGGAIKMNAGCFGSETKDFLKKIEFIDISGNLHKVDLRKLKLTYRSSNLKDTDVVINATFEASIGKIQDINDKLNLIKYQREKKQPLKETTSGSTFKNPLNNFAADLIEKAGCKGLEVGNARVSLKHANFLINNGGASASEIEELGRTIIEKVFQKFNILLDWEIKIVGD